MDGSFSPVQEAASGGRLTKRATCHTFRHSFAAHSLEDSYDDVKTAMSYTHVLNRGPAGVRSPVDSL